MSIPQKAGRNQVDVHKVKVQNNFGKPVVGTTNPVYIRTSSKNMMEMSQIYLRGSSLKNSFFILRYFFLKQESKQIFRRFGGCLTIRSRLARLRLDTAEAGACFQLNAIECTLPGETHRKSASGCREDWTYTWLIEQCN